MTRPSREEEVWVQADGTIRYLESSAFKLDVPGDKTLTRVSRIVEKDGRHHVLDEATGRDLGGFPTRQAALDFERRRYALNERCSECGTRFHCGAGEDACWCAELPPVECRPSARSCLCPACLRRAAASGEARL